MIRLNKEFGKLKLLNLLLVGITGLVVLSPTFAQSYPDRPIKMVVPYPPGGSTDNLARVFTQELSKVVGVPVIVDNKPGGGTTVGAIYVNNSPADGYTLLFQVDGLYNGKLSAPTVPYE